MSALRRLSAAIVLTISMLLLSSGLAAAEPTSQASGWSDRDQCDHYNPCKRDHRKYDDHKGSYKKHSSKLLDLKLRVKLLETQKKTWERKAKDHDDEADRHWKKSKDYKYKDWGKSKHYKDKARDHEREAEKCRGKATKYRKAADHERHRYDNHLLSLKLRLTL